MYCKELFVLSVLLISQLVNSLPIGLQAPFNNQNGYNQRISEVFASATPVITEIVPSLQFGDITVGGELPIGGSIKVKGRFPVYGTVAVDGGLPSSGTGIVKSGCGVIAQVI